MRIISVKRLRGFWEQPAYQDSESPLKAWYREALHATWRTPMEIKAKYTSASILKQSRVVFNIAGNKYRLVVKFHYNRGVGYVRFVGTHAEYDEIDAEAV